MDPVQKKTHQHLFIYDFREMITLVCLVGMMGLFTFTLGLHFGKQMNRFTQVAKGKEAPLAKSLTDALPEYERFLADSKGAPEVLEDVLSRELHDEVTLTGIKLDTPQIVELPEKPKDANQGATTLETEMLASAAKKEAKLKETKKEAVSQEKKTSSESLYTLQIGSYTTQEEAKQRLDDLDEEIQKPTLREVDLKEKGKWYRVYVGEFTTRFAAQKAGEQYHSQQMIDSFVITPLTN